MSHASEENARPSEFYARRSHELRGEAEESAARYSRYTFFLVGLGLLACVALYQSVFVKRLPLWAVAGVVPVGVWVVRQRHRCSIKSVQIRSLIEYYDKGVARLGRKWDQLDSGERFIDPDHSYSEDLDLFGHGSLYQLICSARTRVACATLAHWMKAPAKLEEIHARHEAILELRPRRELPESIATAGPMQVTDFRSEFLKIWVGESSPPFPMWAPVAAFLLALIAVILPTVYWAGSIQLHTLWVGFEVVLFTDVVFALTFRGQVKRVMESLETLSIELPAMRELLRIMEQQKFSAAKLKMLADQLGRARPASSDRIQRLLRLIRLVKQRENEWFAYPSFCLLWGTQFAMAIERWRSRYGAQMLEWMAALGEFEALISLSTYSYEHPGDTLPELVENGPVLDAEGLGHPLLEESICVTNNLQLGDSVRFLIVSGSNMSGKSTFLRAVGLNAVLAYMGAPVRCTRLRLSVLVIGAAIRVQDSVVDGRSHFLAEMQRLRRMIEAADHAPLLFLADEIMSGTNSHDRRIAAEWVVRALMLRGAIGAITTHDLALTEIASNGLPGRNVCFEDAGEFGSLTFDYKLRQGVLKHSNALNIAHLLGIDIAAHGK